MGILGISEATAREGEKHNIRVNTIAPVASTGGLAVALSGTNDKNKQPVFRPEYVAPIVLLLSSDTLNGRPNTTTGGLFEVGCGWHASTRLRSASRFKIPSGAETASSPEALSAPWPETTDDPIEFSTASLVKRNRDVLDSIAGLKRVDVHHTEYTYTDNDVMLYSTLRLISPPFLWRAPSSFTIIAL